MNFWTALFIEAIVGYGIFKFALWMESKTYEPKHSYKKPQIPIVPESISPLNRRFYDDDTVNTIEAIFEGYEYSRRTNTIVDMETINGYQDEESTETATEGTEEE